MEVDLRNDENGKPARVAVLGLGKLAAAATVLIATTAAASQSMEAFAEAAESITLPVPRKANVDHPMAGKIGVKFEGAVRPNDVLAYDADEGWVELGRYIVISGNRVWKRERGKILTYRKTGKVEPFWR